MDSSITLTESQITDASKLYSDKVGGLLAYNKLPRALKEIMCAIVIGNVVHMTFKDAHEASAYDDQFQATVDGIIGWYEALHPEKVNEHEQVHERFKELALGLDWEGMEPPTDIAIIPIPEHMISSTPIDPGEFDPVVNDQFEDIISHLAIENGDSPGE